MLVQLFSIGHSTGTNVVARVTGLVLTALAVQVIIVGFQNVFPASM